MNGTGAPGSSVFGVNAPEFDVIERYFMRRVTGSATDAGVALGVGDDAAVTEVPPGHQLLTATDMLIEGTHFLARAPAESVGHRALAVNLSDIAAMGGQPLWASLALSLPELDEDWLAGFASGWFSLADKLGVHLIGGDMARGPRTVTVTVQGLCETGKAIPRSGAHPGDRLFVAGTPGAASVARRRLDRGELNSADPAAAAFLFPVPRVQEGLALAGIASAMIDISDGLGPDLSHLAAVSACGAQVQLDDLHLAVVTDEAELNSHILHGGEDYALLFTVPDARVADLERVQEDWDAPAVCIGEMTSGAAVTWSRNGQPVTLGSTEFRHFPESMHAGV